ncbi:MAG TPA: carboxypeptidase-like regulatory domain-containing protein [Gemmataceae bacterium]|nr:carboxypeptidase-like regulatory domain-containing protein [Gemmataceae bacterium]
MIARSRTRIAARWAAGGLLFIVLAVVGRNDVAGRAPQPADRPAKGVPVTGTCLDEANQPLAGVRVTLYREDYQAKKHERLGAKETGADGRFEFPDAPAVTEDHGLAVVVTRAGRGSIVQPLFDELLRKPLEFHLRPAATLQGKVIDEAGKPVAGARVWARSLRTGPIDGVGTTVTDADGKYAITDMGLWTDEDDRLHPTRVLFDVSHPDFAHERPLWSRMPATIDVVLHPGGVIEGRVTDRVTGKPAGGVTVSLRSVLGTRGAPAGGHAQTGPDGKYEIRRLKAGQYNLWAEAPDRACVAIDSLTVTAGKTLAGQDLSLIEGGWIEGQVVDAATADPVGSAPHRTLHVTCFGPGRPKSGADCHQTQVNEKGQFKVRVAPGLNYPRIITSVMWSRVEGREEYQAGIEVKAGESSKVTFRIGPAKPR